ncbi:hypothetical protein V8C42DRAFT_127524 [Trichoderma barbatum]
MSHRYTLPMEMGEKLQQANPLQDASALKDEVSCETPSHALNESSALAVRARSFSRHVVLAFGQSNNSIIYITLFSFLVRSICGYGGGSQCGELAFIVMNFSNLRCMAAMYYAGR